MITEPGLSKDEGQYDEDTDLNFAEDALRTSQDSKIWLTRGEADDTDLEFEELEEHSDHSLITYSRDPVRATPNVFEVVSYRLASKCNISLIADGQADREAIQSLIDQLTADLHSGFFDRNSSN